MVVGNNRRVMFGILVTYPPAILAAYQEVVQDLYAWALSWAYGPMSELPEEKIEAVLMSEGMKGSNMNMHLFLTALYTWRCIRIDQDNAILSIPFPPCS